MSGSIHAKEFSQRPKDKQGCTREIGVILYAKGTLHGATAPADELSIQDILTVKHDVIPLDGTDVLQQGQIDSVGDRVTLAEDSGDLLRPARKAVGSFGRDAHDAKAWTAKGASFVALASTLLIARKFREAVAELYFHKN